LTRAIRPCLFSLKGNGRRWHAITRKGAGTAISAVRSQATRAVQGGACAGSAQILFPRRPLARMHRI